MAKLAFVDTNVVVYANDARDLRKQRIAQNLLKDLAIHSWAAISSQVIQEFCHVMVRGERPFMATRDLKIVLNEILFPIMLHSPDTVFYESALDFHNRYNLGYYDEFVHSLTYIKLRELSIGYKLPVAKMGWSNFVSGINVSIFAQNPWLIYAKDRDFDPSEISAASGEAGQFPGVRSVGANIKINF